MRWVSASETLALRSGCARTVRLAAAALIHTVIGMGIRTIVFDFGNVLGFFNPRRAAEQLAAYADGLDADAILPLLLDEQLEDEYERGVLDSAAFWVLMRERCRLTCDDAGFDTAYADMFW